MRGVSSIAISSCSSLHLYSLYRIHWHLLFLASPAYCSITLSGVKTTRVTNSKTHVQKRVTWPPDPGGPQASINSINSLGCIDRSVPPMPRVGLLLAWESLTCRLFRTIFCSTTTTTIPLSSSVPAAGAYYSVLYHSCPLSLSYRCD